MSKLVILKLGEGSFDQGFTVTLQIGEEGDRPSTELTGKLPAAPQIPERYKQWQSAYRNLGLPLRLNKPKKQTTQVSLTQPCTEAAKLLRDSLNEWLNSEAFRPVKEGILKKLQPSEVIRLIVQTEDIQRQRLPWHLWEILVEDYTKAEVALSAPEYDRVGAKAPPKKGVKILAILGNSEGIDTHKDRALLEQLPGAEVTFLPEPQRREIADALWEEGWDILCFSGHSKTEGETGRISINKTDSLTVPELKHALRTAVERGLRLAIFNSCDGLGLANDLADLHVPQLIVMREPVPDAVAQEFLKYFLKAFARGESFYLAVREARERLQGIEDKFPCATWLPVICQNPAETPPTWQELGGICAVLDSQAIPACPYRGLFAFREEDAPFFFGRETFTEQLVSAAGRKQLVAVIGASGSGKSSVVFAGLIPRLRAEGNWLILSLRPGVRPFRSLAAALMPVLEPNFSETDRLVEANKLAAALGEGSLALSDVVERIRNKNSGFSQMLLVVDQFEELYTLCCDALERQQWLFSAISAVRSAPQLTVVLTLRADFLGHALSDRLFADALQNADVKLGPMNREELQRAIAEPAQKVGMLIEEGLTERILDAVEGEPGNLPLLEFALSLLWEKPRNGRLTHAAYKEIGGVESALALHAQQVYDKLNSSEQRVAKRIFLELTQLGVGTEDTRRQVLKLDLLQMDSEDLVEPVIQQLAAAKLVVTGEVMESFTRTAVVDVVHEALIRHWPLLRRWVEENREGLIRKRAIEAAAKEWQNQGEPEDLAYLLQGPKLAEAENFLRDLAESVPLSSVARGYIIVSQAARDRFLKEEEERRRRELEQERKARKAAQRTAGAAMVSLFVIVVSGGFAWWQRQQSLRIIEDVSLGIDVGTPQLLAVLPDFLKIADRYRDAGDAERSLSYYRQILTETDKLLKPPSNKPASLQPQERQKLQEISGKAQKSLADTIQKYRLPQLEEELKNGKLGKLPEKTSLLDFENQYTPGALRTTYAIIMRKWGAKADLNDDGELQTPEEAERMPCETLQEIERLWRQSTQNRCGWYGPKSPYLAPSCRELDGQTLTSKIFIVPPFDAATARLNFCQIGSSRGN
jgi:hypothetical protein